MEGAILAGKLAAEVVAARAVGASAPGDKVIQQHVIDEAATASPKKPVGCKGRTAVAFGGGPKRVMVFGVSAGGAAVAHLLTTAPPGLIFAAAMESPGGHQGWMAPGSRPDDDFVAICLRKAPNSDIITAAEGVRFAPSLVRRRPANPLSADGVETPLASRRASPTVLR